MHSSNSGLAGFLDAQQDNIMWVLRVAAIGFALATIYFIYGIVAHPGELFHGVAATGQALSPADFQRQLNNLDMGTKLMMTCAIVGILCVIARYYAAPETGVALIVLGLLLFFGMPYLMDTYGASGSPLKPALAKLGNPLNFLKAEYVLAGAAFIGAGVIFLMGHAVYFVTNAGARRPRANAEAAKTAQSVRKPQDKFLGRCWELPFCRDTDKMMCPIRQAKKPCWRGGRGCYCDQNIILALTGGSAYQASTGSLGYASRVASTIAKPKSYAEKRDQCLQCPVYLHHQAQKYKIMAPLFLIGVIAAIALLWMPITTGYPAAMQALGRAASGISFGTSTNGVPAWANELASSTPMMYMAVGVIALLCLSYVLHALEWILYRLGM